MSQKGRRREVPVLNNSVVKETTEFKCLVENCNTDLSTAKKYYQRHNVCQEHLKMNQILVDGQLQRFCQQCGKFHAIYLFDKDKRSCRDSLKKHKQNRDEKTAKKTNSGGSMDSEGGFPPVDIRQGVKRRPATPIIDSHAEVSAKRPFLDQQASDKNLVPSFDITPFESQFQPIQRQTSEPILPPILPPQLSSATSHPLMHAYSMTSLINLQQPKKSFLQSTAQNWWDRDITMDINNENNNIHTSRSIAMDIVQHEINNEKNVNNDNINTNRSIAMDIVQNEINNEKNNININTSRNITMDSVQHEIYNEKNDAVNSSPIQQKIKDSIHLYNVVSNKKSSSADFNISAYNNINNNNRNLFGYTGLLGRLNTEGDNRNMDKQSIGKQTNDLNDIGDVEDLPAGCCFHPGDFDSNGLLDLTKIKISDQVQLYSSLQDRPDYCYIIRNNDFNV